MKKLFIFSFLFLLIISVCFAELDYTQLSTSNNNFRLGTGLFNDVIDLDSKSSAVITTPRAYPLIADLNNDSIKEIIVIDNQDIKLFQGKSLTPIASLTSSFTLSTQSHILVNDIDFDGYKEIIVASDDKTNLDIMEYNGTGLYLQKRIKMGGNLTKVNPGHTADEIFINCNNNGVCLHISTESDLATSGVSRDIVALTFNATDVINATIIDTSTLGATFCFPKIRYMAMGDYDNDGIDDFVITYKRSDSGDPDIEISWIKLRDDNSPYLAQNTVITAVGNFGGFNIGQSCEGQNTERYFTSPLLLSTTGFPQLDVAVGFMISSNDFKIHLFDSGANFIDDFPKVQNGEGQLVSNVFKANVFDDTADVDFCVLGYEETAELLNLICGSQQTTHLFKTWEWDYDIGEIPLAIRHNISFDYGDITILTHTVNNKNNPIGANDIDEILTSYGVFSLSETTLSFGDMNLIYSNPIQLPNRDAIMIQAGSENNIIYDDILALTSSNLWYIDDGFINSQARITSYTINPCLDGVWKINTSLEITITAEDIDGDNIQAKAILYKGNTNEQASEWSPNATTGATFTFNDFDFKVNKTISNGVISLIVRDTENQDTNDTINLLFSVANSGLEFGDCITSVDVGLPEEETILLNCSDGNIDAGEECDDGNDIDGDGCSSDCKIEQGYDTISKTIDSMVGVTGINLSKGIIWLLVMGVVAYLIWVNGSPKTPAITFAVMGIVEVLLLAVGIKLAFISVIYLFIVIIIGLGSIAIILRKQATGG